MKRFFLFVFLAACGTSAADDIVTDASIDQTQDAKSDVTTKDATADASDASDVSQLDVIVDAITIDVKNGCADNNACNSNEFCDKGTANCGGFGKCTAVPQ